MHSNPNTYGLTATEKVKSKIPGTTEHAITHPHHGTGIGTGHMHTPTGSHTNLGHESMVTGPSAPMAGTGMGHQSVVTGPSAPMAGTGLAQPAVGQAVPSQIGHHPMQPGHHTHGVGQGAVGSTAGMSTTQKIASKVPGTTEYKMTH